MRPGLKSKYFLFLITFILTLFLIITGCYVASALTVCISYIINEVLYSDHINYSPDINYNYEFDGVVAEKVQLSSNRLSIPEKYINAGYTLLVELEIQASFAGKFLDPYIETQSDKSPLRQYFERSCNGIRYLNISHGHFDNDSSMTLNPEFCKINEDSARLFPFKNPMLDQQKVLVIAPHPDDAEIAAFSLYKHSDSMVVTITAGESEPNQQQYKLEKDNVKATALIGRLRALDSITVPIWAGLKPGRAINLGYSDNSLERLHIRQDEEHPAPHRAQFKQYNLTEQSSSIQNIACWTQLTGELKEIIDDFRPDIIVTPHPDIDAHSDHKFSTIAILDALNLSEHNIKCFLFYVNHLPTTDQWPFGPQGSLVALPPGQYQLECGIFSLPVDDNTQIDKACALEMMHDLRKPQKLKRILRAWLQAKLIKRPISPLGIEPFLRKAVRRNELFILKNFNK